MKKLVQKSGLLLLMNILALHLIFTESSVFAATITTPVFTKSSYGVYEKVQATFQLSATYSNPYDSAVIQVDAQVSIPGGGQVTVPCFYYVPTKLSGDAATPNTAGAVWMLRYTPTKVGTYSVTIKAIPNGVTANGYSSSSATFSVTSSNLPGFVRLDPNNKQFYRFDNGTPYYPVGINLAWNSGNPFTSFYHNYLNSIGTGGITWMRYWLTDFARQALEWSSSHWSGFYGGLGVYSQQSAALLDSVVQECAGHGIYIQLALQHHGQFSVGVNPEWTDNPYNTKNGGFLKKPCGYFTSAQAVGQTKKQYRYIVARWGYSPNLFAWELFNEVNFAGDTTNSYCAQADIVSWHKTMSAYLKSVDVNKRLVTTSCGNAGNPILAAMDGNATSLDILQFHDYVSAPVESPLLADDISALSTYSKSTFCGEFGASGDYNSSAPVWADNQGDHFRKTAWLGAMNKVPNMFWYWDGYINTKNLYHVLTPLVSYFQGTDIVKETGANSGAFAFANNPAIVGTVTATPSKSFSTWPCTNSPDPWSATVGPDGSVPGLNTLCSYLMGSWTGASQSVSFTVTFQSAGTATMNLAGSSTSGTNGVQIFIDGVSTKTSSIASGASGAYSVNVPAGTHVIRFYNNGQDWLQVNNYAFTNVGLSKCVAYGYRGDEHVYGYVYDKSYGAWADSASVAAISNASLKIGPMKPGSYSVSFSDPKGGDMTKELLVVTTTASDSIVVPIRSFKKDIAFKIAPYVAPLGLDDVSNGTLSSAFYASPNPFRSSTNIHVNLPSASPLRIAVYDQMGKQVAVLADKWFDAGTNIVEFDRKGLLPGVYFCQINGQSSKSTLKIVAE